MEVHGRSPYSDIFANLESKKIIIIVITGTKADTIWLIFILKLDVKMSITSYYGATLSLGILISHFAHLKQQFSH